jgi:hypothetical protein
MCDIINICNYYATRDYSLEIEAGRLVGMGFMRYFVMRGLEMQLLLWCTLIDWLGIFCMARIICRKYVVPWNRYCGPSSVPSMKRKTVCIVRKGEKQIQILDGY